MTWKDDADRQGRKIAAEFLSTPVHAVDRRAFIYGSMVATEVLMHDLTPISDDAYHSLFSMHEALRAALGDGFVVGGAVTTDALPSLLGTITDINGIWCAVRFPDLELSYMLRKSDLKLVTPPNIVDELNRQVVEQATSNTNLRRLLAKSDEETQRFWGMAVALRRTLVTVRPLLPVRWVARINRLLDKYPESGPVTQPSAGEHCE